MKGATERRVNPGSRRGRPGSTRPPRVPVSERSSVVGGISIAGPSALLTAALGAAFLFLSASSFVPDTVSADPNSGHRARGYTVEDPDGDGLPSTLEFLLGCDEFDPDSDGDSYDDALEATLGTDPLVPDTAIELRSGVGVHFLPVADNHLGVLVTIYAQHGFDALERFRIVGGRGTQLLDRTSDLRRRGMSLPTSNDRLESILVVVPVDYIEDRLTVIAEILEFGTLYSVTKAFGHYAGEYFVQRYEDGGDGYLYGRYGFLGPHPYQFVPGIGGQWGGARVEIEGSGMGEEFLDDRVFTEQILRVRRRGVIIDTVIGNECEEEPDERCPTSLKTIGEVRIGPAR